MKFGEIVGLAVRDATLEALRWQNGLEPSYTRGVFHALGRYGVREATIFDDFAPLLDADGSGAAAAEQQGAPFYEPLVGAAAHALAAVLDRVRHGTLPASIAARRHRPAGGDAGGQPRGQRRPLAGVPRTLHAARARRSRRATRSSIRCRWSPRARARLEREVARALIPPWLAPLAPSPIVLGAAVALDLALGDPDLSRASGAADRRARSRGSSAACAALGADGYGGGIAALRRSSRRSVVGAGRRRSCSPPRAVAAWLAAGSCTSSCSTACSRSAICCVTCGASSARCRAATSTAAVPRSARLVGRDTDRMDAAACRRAAIESLSENLTDGFTSAVFWYALGGLPGLVLFKVVSTMDSMVGYKTPRYLRFGWCGARLDDVMNYVPARLTWLLIAADRAASIPGCSALEALARRLHAARVLPGPNSGWSEAATAGALRRRIVGPIWLRGDAGDRRLDRRSRRSAGSSRADVMRAMAARHGRPAPGRGAGDRRRSRSIVI